MDQFELYEFPSMEDDWTVPRSLLCWQCKRDVNKTDLISPCNCTNVYIHVYCLKEIANTSDIIYCPCCNARYPLEVRPKSLLKMIWKICISLFIILFFICLNVITGLIVYITLSIKVQNQISFILQIIVLSLFLWFIYMIVQEIVNRSNRIYEYYHQWYKSTYEWKLIRPSTDKNIEEYNIQE